MRFPSHRLPILLKKRVTVFLARVGVLMSRYDSVSLSHDAIQLLRKAVLLRYGIIYGKLGSEASLAIERHARRLMADEEVEP